MKCSYRGDLLLAMKNDCIFWPLELTSEEAAFEVRLARVCQE